MRTKEDPPDLIWFLPTIFALGALVTGDTAIYALTDPDMRNEVGLSLFTPIAALVVLPIRATGYWHFLKQRTRAIGWLSAALVASIVSAIVDITNYGTGGYIQQHGPI